MIQSRYDKIAIKAVVTDEGWIRDRPVITRSGIFIYRNRNGKEIKEWRPEEEVFKEDSLATLAGIPITNEHQGMITVDNTSPIIGTVVSSGVKQDSNVLADVVIHNPKQLGSKRELSLGYRANVIEGAGVTPAGEHYDSKQTNIVYNHLAIVSAGRAGNARLRLDNDDASSFDVENEPMADPKQVSLRLDSGIEYFAPPEVANAFTKMSDDLKKRIAAYDKLQAEHDSLKQENDEAKKSLKEVLTESTATKLPELALEVADSLKSMPERIKARTELESEAKKRDVKFDAKDTDRAIREAIVTKIRGDAIKFDGKSDDYVASAYDLSLTISDDKTRKVGEQRVASHKSDSSTQQSGGGAAAARSRMVANIRAGR